MAFRELASAPTRAPCRVRAAATSRAGRLLAVSIVGLAFLLPAPLAHASTWLGAPQEPGADSLAAVATVTLEEAVELALANSPSVVQGVGAVRTAKWGERRAFGSFLPDLTFSSGASRASSERFNPQTNTTVSGSSDSYTASLFASVEVFSGGRQGAELRRARAETSAAEATLVTERFAVVLAAKRAFFDELRATELIRVSRERLRRAEEGLAAAQLRLDLGSATRSDVLRSRLELTDARQALLAAENERRRAAFALGRIVGAEGPVAAAPSEALAPGPLAVSEPELLELAVNRSPAVLASEAAVRSGEAGARAAGAQYFPSVRLQGGSDWFNQDPALDGGRLSWDLRLGLSYPLFDGFVREESVARAEVEADVARARLADERRSARAELERLLAALHLAEQQIALAEEAVEVAEEDLRVQRERYGAGASTILDQITSQLNLAEAEVELVAARYDHQLARAELEALVGREL
jgi:outer membrane protein